MARSLIFLASCVLAALSPLLPFPGPSSAEDAPFPGWPEAIEGRPLEARPMEERDERFARDFPGRIARFHDGRYEWILRWTAAPTRRVHSAFDCYRALGYRIEHLPLEPDDAGRLWGVFLARKDEERYRVRVRFHDAAGNSWTDRSSWYWSAASGRSTGPWWAFTRVERLSAD